MKDCEVLTRYVQVEVDPWYWQTVMRHWTCLLPSEHRGRCLYRVLSDEDALFSYTSKRDLRDRRERVVWGRNKDREDE